MCCPGLLHVALCCCDVYVVVVCWLLSWRTSYYVTGRSEDLKVVVAGSVVGAATLISVTIVCICW